MANSATPAITQATCPTALVSGSATITLTSNQYCAFQVGETSGSSFVYYSAKLVSGAAVTTGFTVVTESANVVSVF